MSRDRRALITGVTGQDGSYLAELLLEEGYEVFGMTRRASTENVERIAHLADRLTLLQGDLLDPSSLEAALRAAQPAEVYNLAAQSFVPTSWNQPVLTAEFTAVGVTRMLEAIRSVGPEIRFYQASSSEMFGKVREVPQTELTPFHPRSPYGVAKVYGHHITVNYRESYDLFAVSGISFNHECLRASTPLLFRENGVLAVKTPADVVPLRAKGASVQCYEPDGLLEVWAGDDWTPVKAITATRRRPGDPDHEILSIEARGGVVEVTIRPAGRRRPRSWPNCSGCWSPTASSTEAAKVSASPITTGDSGYVSPSYGRAPSLAHPASTSGDRAGTPTRRSEN